MDTLKEAMNELNLRLSSPDDYDVAKHIIEERLNLSLLVLAMLPGEEVLRGIRERLLEIDDEEQRELLAEELFGSAVAERFLEGK